MAIKYIDECVGCPPEMGCLGSACPNIHIPCYYCDDCGEETDLYYFEGEELCINCIEHKLERVN